MLTGDPSDQADARMITNIVPMYPTFRTAIWTALWDKTVNSMGAANGGLVIAGPVFDHQPRFGAADSVDNLT